jgi:hypothetical protein
MWDKPVMAGQYLERCDKMQPSATDLRCFSVVEGGLGWREVWGPDES